MEALFMAGTFEMQAMMSTTTEASPPFVASRPAGVGEFYGAGCVVKSRLANRPWTEFLWPPEYALKYQGYFTPGLQCLIGC
jgi:hypothetical protein